LPSSPHFDDVANIVADLKAFVSDAIARARQEDAQSQQLLAKQAARARQDEAAAARTRQEAAFVSDAIARARQENA
jgi:hypothetical protein